MKINTWKRLAVLVFLLFAAAACEGEIPPPPPITVVITAVSDGGAVQNSVDATLTGIAQEAFNQTATVIAQGGMTLTPSLTWTPTITLTATPTRFVTPTATPQASPSFTPTYAPYASNTPSPLDSAAEGVGWVRVLHAWRDISQLSPEHTAPVDVYINDERVSRELTRGEQSNTFQVLAGAVRITLRAVDDYTLPAPIPPLMSSTVTVAAGQAVSVVVGDFGNGLTALPIVEDTTPLASGAARLTVVQGNRELLPFNVLYSPQKRAIAYNFGAGQVAGSFDLPSGDYNFDLYDVQRPDLLLGVLSHISLISRLNTLVVTTPYRGTDSQFSDYLVFSGNARLIQTDVYARFINIASRVGAVQVGLDSRPLLSSLKVGEISAPIPVSRDGSTLVVASTAGQEFFNGLLGPWTEDGQGHSDKIVLITDTSTVTGQVTVELLPFAQNPPRSTINASVRIVHALPGTVPLALEMRLVQTEVITDANGQQAVVQIGEDRIPWVTFDQASIGLASAYKARTPGVYDVRIVQAGSRNVLYTVPRVELKAGGVYDFVALPAVGGTSAQLALVEPQTQITDISIPVGDPTSVAEAVYGTLTALAPQVTREATQTATPTATPTPIATNTPRATAAFSLASPTLLIDPAPPNVAIGTFTLVGTGFAPNGILQVIWDTNLKIAESTVSSDGTFVLSVTIPDGTARGPHAFSVCNDCRAGGAQQSLYAVVVTG